MDASLVQGAAGSGSVQRLVVHDGHDSVHWTQITELASNLESVDLESTCD